MSEEALVQEENTENQETENAEAVQAEATPEARTEEVVPEVDFSAEFSRLKKQEKALRAERNKMKAEIEAERKRWTEELRSDPLARLKEHGITTEQLASAMLGEEPLPVQEQASTPAVDPALQKKIEELEAYRQEQVLASFRKEVFDVVEQSPEEYELVLNSKDGRDLYWNAVVEYYQSYGEAPDYAELANGVESALLEEGKRLLSLNKLKPAEPEAPKVEEKVVEEAPDSEQESDYKTLSNKITADSFGNRVKVSPAQSGARSVTSEYNRYMEESRQKILDKLK